jgi:hypothetical protein
MLLPVEEIKNAILHPEPLVREQALRYFTQSWSADPAVMPLAVEAMRKYEWRLPLQPHLDLARLRQTPETLSWFIDELEQTKPSPQDLDYHDYLWTIVGAADVDLLRPHEDRLLRFPDVGHHKKVASRIRLANLLPADCWREIEEFCEAEKNTQYAYEVDLGRADLLVEAIGRDVASADRVLSLLAMNIDEESGNPTAWMERLAVVIAGEMRLKPAIPHLIAKLTAELGDWISDRCCRALSKIGGDEVADAVCREFESSWDFRIYAAGVLEKNRSPGVAARALALYEAERNREGEENELIEAALLLAGLDNFASEAIEPGRQFVLGDNCEIETVRERLVALGMLMGITFRELMQWKKRCEECRREFEQLIKESSLWKRAPAHPAAQRDRIAVAPEPPREPEPPAEEVEVTQPFHSGQPIRAAQKVGRNDPCPCGSGKKHKKCCMNKA